MHESEAREDSQTSGEQGTQPRPTSEVASASRTVPWHIVENSVEMLLEDAKDADRDSGHDQRENWRYGHAYTIAHWFKSLSDPARVSRVEVIDETGRAFSRWRCSIELSYQDQGRTLKVFVSPSAGEARSSGISSRSIPTVNDAETKSIQSADQWQDIATAIRAFVDRVNARAEADMLIGNPVTGAHHRALEVELAQLKPPQDLPVQG